MIEAFLYGLLIAIIIFFIMSLKKRYVFKIKVEHTSVSIEYGHPPLKFIEECEKAVLFHKPKKGYIYGKKGNKHICLKFSKDFEDRKQQVFRNIWTEYPPIINIKGGKKSG